MAIYIDGEIHERIHVGDNIPDDTDDHIRAFADGLLVHERQDPDTVDSWSPLFIAQQADFVQTGIDANDIEGTRDVTVTDTPLDNENSTESTINQDIDSDGDLYDDITRTRNLFSASVTAGAEIANTHTELGDWTVTVDRDLNFNAIVNWNPEFIAQTSNFVQTGTHVLTGVTLSGERTVTVATTLTNPVSTETGEGVDVDSNPSTNLNITRTSNEYDASVTVGSAITNTHFVFGDWVATLTQFDPASVTSWSPSFALQTTNFQQTGSDDRGVLGARDVAISATALTNQSSTEGAEGIDVNNDGDLNDVIERSITRYSASVIVGSSISNTHNVNGDWFVVSNLAFNPNTVSSWAPSFGVQTGDFQQTGSDGNSISGTREVDVSSVNIPQTSTETLQNINVDGNANTNLNIARTVVRYGATVAVGSVISNTHDINGDWVATATPFSPGDVTTWSPSFILQTAGFNQSGTDNRGIDGNRTVTVSDQALANEETSEAALGIDVNNDGDMSDLVERTRTQYSATVSEGTSITNTHIVLGSYFVTTNIDFDPSLVTTWSPAFGSQTANFTQSGTDSNGNDGVRGVTVTPTSVVERSSESSIGDDVNNDGDLLDLIERTNTTYEATAEGSSIGSRTDLGTYVVYEDNDALDTAAFGAETVLTDSPPGTTNVTGTFGSYGSFFNLSTGAATTASTRTETVVSACQNPTTSFNSYSTPRNLQTGQRTRSRTDFTNRAAYDRIDRQQCLVTVNGQTDSPAPTCAREYTSGDPIAGNAFENFNTTIGSTSVPNTVTDTGTFNTGTIISGTESLVSSQTVANSAYTVTTGQLQSTTFANSDVVYFNPSGGDSAEYSSRQSAANAFAASSPTSSDWNCGSSVCGTVTCTASITKRTYRTRTQNFASEDCLGAAISGTATSTTSLRHDFSDTSENETASVNLGTCATLSASISGSGSGRTPRSLTCSPGGTATGTTTYAWSTSGGVNLTSASTATVGISYTGNAPEFDYDVTCNITRGGLSASASGGGTILPPFGGGE